MYHFWSAAANPLFEFSLFKKTIAFVGTFFYPAETPPPRTGLGFIFFLRNFRFFHVLHLVYISTSTCNGIST